MTFGPDDIGLSKNDLFKGNSASNMHRCTKFGQNLLKDSENTNNNSWNEDGGIRQKAEERMIELKARLGLYSRQWKLKTIKTKEGEWYSRQTIGQLIYDYMAKTRNGSHGLGR